MDIGRQVPPAGNMARTGLAEHTEQSAGPTRPEEQPRAVKPPQAGESEWRIADTARTAAWAVPETGPAATPAAAGRPKTGERPADRLQPAWFRHQPAWFPAQCAEFRRQRAGFPSQPVQSPAEDRRSASSPGFREPRYSADSPSRQTTRRELLLGHPVQVGPQHLHVRPPNLQVGPRTLHVRPKTLQVRSQTMQVRPEPLRIRPCHPLMPTAAPAHPMAPARPATPNSPAVPAHPPAPGSHTATAASRPIVPVALARIAASADSHPPADVLHSYSCRPTYAPFLNVT